MEPIKPDCYGIFYGLETECYECPYAMECRDIVEAKRKRSNDNQETKA